MQSEPDFTHFVVVGVGINVNQSEMPPEMKSDEVLVVNLSGRGDKDII